jgi:peptide/nickel transport system substrate-binding protein
MKRVFHVLCVLVLVLGLSGLAQAAGEDLADEQVLNIAFDAGDAKTLDPHRAASTVDRSTVDPIFNGLVRYPPGQQVEFEPDIAKSWEVSEDGKTWTFHLRKGVFFHPFPGHPEGYELTAEDVVYSLERASDSSYSSYAGEYKGMTFKAVDDSTLQITVEDPVSETLFLAKFANYAGGFIVCKKAIEEKGNEWFGINPVGTGPFMFENYTPREKVVLAGYEKYFRGTPHLKQVNINYMPNVSSREFGLRTGEMDIIEGMNEAKWVEKVSTFDDVKVSTFGPCETQMLHYNMSREPFDDIRVRKAFSYAISRQGVASFMGQSLAVPIYSPALAPPAPGALTRDKAMEAGVVYEDNLEKARELLAEAGYEDGLSVKMNISELATSYKKPMVALQAQLKKAGIDLKLQVVDHSSYHSLIRDDANPMVYYACWRPNVDVHLTRFYHSDSIVVSGDSPDTNFSHYGGTDADGDGNVDSIDSLIEEARYILDKDKQIELWEQAQVQLLEDCAVTPMIRLKYAFPMKTYVELGHPLEFSWQTYSPQITENTRILAH